MCRSTVMSAENGWHDHGDRPSDASTSNLSFKYYLPALCSPMVAVADSSGNVDEAWMLVVLSFYRPMGSTRFLTYI